MSKSTKTPTVEDIATAMGADNIKDARAVRKSRFITTQDMYRFQNTYNKFEQGDDPTYTPTKRPIELRYKKMPIKAGISKEDYEKLQNVYLPQNKNLEEVSSGYDNTTIRGEDYMQNQRIHITEKITKQCYDKILFRLLKEQSSASSEKHSQYPTSGWWEDVTSGAGDVLRWAGPVQHLIPTNTTNPYLKATKAILRAGAGTAAVADAATLYGATVVNDPRNPAVSTTPWTTASLQLAGSLAGVFPDPIWGIKSAASKAMQTHTQGTFALPPSVSKIPSNVGERAAASATNAAVNLAAMATERSTTDPSRLNPIPNSKDNFQFVKDFLDRLGFPAQEVRPNIAPYTPRADEPEPEPTTNGGPGGQGGQGGQGTTREERKRKEHEEWKNKTEAETGEAKKRAATGAGVKWD